MRALLAPFKDLRRAGRAEHGMQTNATLITTPWIELLTEHGRRWTAAAVAAGVLALGGMATIWVVQEQRVRDADRQAAQLRDVLAAGDVQVRTTTVSGGGKITVAVSASRNGGVAVLSDLPVPPEGRVYQLWLIDGSSPRSAGVMAAGQRSGITPLAAIAGADTLGVTLEPEGGSPAPTSGPLAGVPLA
jgi:anti-sigma-K factor RskA